MRWRSSGKRPGRVPSGRLRLDERLFTAERAGRSAGRKPESAMARRVERWDELRLCWWAGSFGWRDRTTWEADRERLEKECFDELLEPAVKRFDEITIRFSAFIATCGSPWACKLHRSAIDLDRRTTIYADLVLRWFASFLLRSKSLFRRRVLHFSRV